MNGSKGAWWFAAAGAVVFPVVTALGGGEPNPRESWFAFAIPVLHDRAPAFDLRGLNERVAGDRGWLRVDGERIVDSEVREFRLFGTNLTAAACFPEESQAGPYARNLARLGYNVVRLHFLDNQWGRGVPGLLPHSNDVARDGLRADSLARLDRFLAELKAAGVRVNLNLHVGRQFPGWQEPLPRMSKGTGNFMPDDIAELKRYCKLVLEHVNPHTGVALKDDPAISILEISNEDSLVNDPWWTSRMPEPHAGELKRQWNRWLADNGRDGATLRREWGVYQGVAGPEVAPPLARWILERHDGAQASVEPAKEGNEVTWRADKPGSASWHLQLGSGKLEIDPAKCYRIAFRARSQTGNPVSLGAGQAGGEWHNCGLHEELKLTPEWRDFSYRWFPSRIDREHGTRFTFSLLNRTGTVEIAGFSCRQDSTGYLTDGQAPEAGTVPLPEAGSPEPVRRAYLEFLAAVEIRFAGEIKGFLKGELGCRQLVSHSQVSFGGPLGARREFAVSDFVDTHGYWHHPRWPNRQWDPRDWNIVNASQIATPGGGTLAEIAFGRPAGKPYSVSEYDIPAPNDHAAEMWPMFAAMACFQSWSAIYHYTYAHTAEDLQSTKISGYFNGAAHPAKEGMRPAAALIHRLGLVAPAKGRQVLRIGDRAVFDSATRRNGAMWGADRALWQDLAKLDGAAVMSHGVALDLRDRRAAADLTQEGVVPTAAGVSDTGECRWSAGEESWTLAAPAARAWCGRAVATGKRLLDTTCRLPAGATLDGHATVVLVALDGKPLAQAGRLLVTAMRRAENEGMVWNADRTSVGDQWGRGPVRVLGVNAELELPPGTRWTATTLDPSGQRAQVVATKESILRMSPDHRTIWWLLERTD